MTVLSVLHAVAERYGIPKTTIHEGVKYHLTQIVPEDPGPGEFTVRAEYRAQGKVEPLVCCVKIGGL